MQRSSVVLPGVPDHFFPPETLREYALLADGERGAVIGPRGNVAFLCIPRWHDDAVFASLIGGSGQYAVTPCDPWFTWGGHYEPGTLIWRSRWVTSTTVIECREALALPADSRRAVLLRRIEAHRGDARVRIALDARAGYGAHQMALRAPTPGIWEGTCGPLALRWTGAPDGAVHQGGAVTGDLVVPEGRHHDLVLEIGTGAPEDGPVDPEEAWQRTADRWADGSPAVEGTLGAGDVSHSYAVLRGLTSSSGGMVAAATMSLPERAERGRSYDYRYAWVRDQCYAGQAAAAVGGAPLVDAAVRFVSERLLSDGPKLRPAYTVEGGPVPGERHLDLPGYPGGTDIAGNHANDQFQLDALGEALLLFAAAARMDLLGPQGRAAADVAVEVITTRRRDPDAGIWELDDRHWAHSRLICAAGLRAMAVHRGRAEAESWTSLADRIVADVDRDCRHPSGRWQRSPDDARVDAALLMAAVRGAVPADDPRSVTTWEAVRRDLGRDGYVYRFRQDDGPLNEAEGAFVLCGFQMALATHQQGRTVEAVRWFERNRAAMGSPGLFAEEFDVVERQLRGNLPQAFVHALHVETARRLSDPAT